MCFLQEVFFLAPYDLGNQSASDNNIAYLFLLVKKILTKIFIKAKNYKKMLKIYDILLKNVLNSIKIQICLKISNCFNNKLYGSCFKSTIRH